MCTCVSALAYVKCIISLSCGASILVKEKSLPPAMQTRQSSPCLPSTFITTQNTAHLLHMSMLFAGYLFSEGSLLCWPMLEGVPGGFLNAQRYSCLSCLACRDSFVGEAQALVAPKMAPWAAAAGRHQEESASDLEGGDSGYHQEHFTQPPPPPPRKPAPAKEEKKKTAQVCTVQQSD